MTAYVSLALLQAKKQAKDDRKLLAEADSMHQKDTRLIKKAASGDGLEVRRAHSGAVSRLLNKATADSSAMTEAEKHAGKATEGLVSREEKRILTASASKTSKEFEASRLRSDAQQRLADKAKIAAYKDNADKKAHHTVETLPYILPPVGEYFTSFSHCFVTGPS